MYSMVHSKVNFSFSPTRSRDVSPREADLSRTVLKTAPYAVLRTVFEYREGTFTKLK